MSNEKPYRKLTDLPRKDIFKTPEGYFEQLPDSVAKRIRQKKESKVVAFRPWAFAGIAAAAAIALLIAFGPSLLTPGQPRTSAEDLLAGVSDEACLAYLKNAELDVEEILELPDPQLWDEALEGAIVEPEVSDEDVDLLYEEYGVSPDENLQLL
jgi:hypothetical protein